MSVKLHHLVNRYKHDTHLLNDYKREEYQKELLRKRIERHKKAIIEFVTSDSFVEKMQQEEI